MHRAVTAVVVGALMCPPGVAVAAGGPVPRVVSATYTLGGVEVPIGNGWTVRARTTALGLSLQGVAASSHIDENVVSIEVHDVLSPRVLASVTQPGPDGTELELGRFCTDGGPRRLRLVRPGQPVNVYPLSGVCATGPAAVLAGTVTWRFSH